MTWIVGTVPPFGYSLLVSDICVSWPDGTEKHCLQKMHKVGEDFLCGFADSVKLGFVILHALADQMPRKQRRLPLDAIAREWIPSLARRIFASAPEEERRSGCHLIAAAAHPNQNLGDAPFPRTYVWTYRFPSFNVEQCGPNSAIGIGSGSTNPLYTAALEKARGNFFFLQLITHGKFAQAQFLARTMYDAITDKPMGGVAPLLQYGVLSRGEAHLGEFSFKRLFPDRPEKVVTVPNVATTYEAFNEMCQSSDADPSGAIC